MNKLKVGMIGAGSIAKVHAGVLQLRSDVELVSVADVAPVPLAAFAEKFGNPRVYTNYAQMLSEEELDIVFVCSPPFTHADATVKALEAGCHVLGEKPPAMNVAEASRMAQEAEKRNLRLFYGLHKRFQPNVQAARKYLDENRLGQVYHGSTHWFRRRGIPGLGSWFTSRAIAGAGALYDIGIHVFDLTHFLMGQPKPVTVSAVTHCKFGNVPERYNYLSMWGTRVPGGIFDVEDMGVFLVRFENGASLVVQTSWAANTEEGVEARIMGDRGGIMINGGDGKSLSILTEDNGFIANIQPQLKKDSTRPDMVQHFIDCIRDPQKKLLTDGRDGLVLQAMLDAVEESAKTNREVPVTIPEVVAD